MYDMGYVLDWVERRQGAGTAAALQARMHAVLSAIDKAPDKTPEGVLILDLFAQARKLAWHLRNRANDIEAAQHPPPNRDQAEPPPQPEHATHRHPSPPREDEASSHPPRSRRPNETTEQPVIDLLHKLGAIGLEGLRAIEKKNRPTAERLAPKAIGRHCDGQFKQTLAHMVDLGWLDNGRLHGLGGGYFLTEAGVALVTQKKRSGLGQD